DAPLRTVQNGSSTFPLRSSPRLFAYLHLAPLAQLFGRKRRPKIVPVRLLQNRQCLSLRICRQLPIGRPSPPPMHHHGITLLALTLQQRAHPAVADAHLFRGLPLCDHTILCALQPLQAISFLLAHRDSSI